MNTISARTFDFYDRNVTKKIIEKYNISDREALRSFLESETYQMLKDAETEVYMMSPAILFDMWEVEKITGDPRNSVYIRG